MLNWIKRRNWFSDSSEQKSDLKQRYTWDFQRSLIIVESGKERTCLTQEFDMPVTLKRNDSVSELVTQRVTETHRKVNLSLVLWFLGVCKSLSISRQFSWVFFCQTRQKHREKNHEINEQFLPWTPLRVTTSQFFERKNSPSFKFVWKRRLAVNFSHTDFRHCLNSLCRWFSNSYVCLCLSQEVNIESTRERDYTVVKGF
jgi:hypothetical protein